MADQEDQERTDSAVSTIHDADSEVDEPADIKLTDTPERRGTDQDSGLFTELKMVQQHQQEQEESYRRDIDLQNLWIGEEHKRAKQRQAEALEMGRRS